MTKYDIIRLMSEDPEQISAVMHEQKLWGKSWLPSRSKPAHTYLFTRGKRGGPKDFRALLVRTEQTTQRTANARFTLPKPETKLCP